MVITSDLKKAICSLFEVHADESGVQRVVTPLEYSGSGDRIVVRVRPLQGGQGFQIDENGEAAFYASMNGADMESEAVGRWAAEIGSRPPLEFVDEQISVTCKDERLIAPSIFRVAEAAQQLHAIATSRADRQSSDFKERISQILLALAQENNMTLESDVVLPIAGGLKADHVIGSEKPLIIVVATSDTRLLEAEVIYMQYRADKRPGYILAVAESQAMVGKAQYERAGYYTDRTVIFESSAFRTLIANDAMSHFH